MTAPAPKPCLRCGGALTIHENDWCQPSEWLFQCAGCGLSGKQWPTEAEAVADANRLGVDTEDAARCHALMWLPMETAPRDDTDVLLRFTRRRMAIGWRASEEWLSSDADDPLPDPVGWLPLDVLASLPPPPPIPTDVYYRAKSDNFYDMTANVGMGMGFWTKWRARKHEFPTEPGASS